ncbi:MAG: hypothetical protein GX759_05500 [Thermoanaerobacterales bacterium]|jgi:hypothetical protein|nr:hypothetical protein [Thermoanaerobacterales bacterium]
MKKGLLVVIALLAVASIMAAMAYTSARVTNPATMAIVNSGKAFLRIYPSFTQNNPGTSYKDVNVFIDEDGRFKFDFTKGAWGAGSVGFQPGSRYEFEDLFCIYNGSKDTVRYWLENDGIEYISIKAGNTYLIKDGVSTGNKITLGSSTGTWYLDVIFDIPEDADLENISGNIIVHSEAV